MNNAAYRKAGVDRLVGKQDYGFSNLKEIYKSSGLLENGRLQFCNMERVSCPKISFKQASQKHDSLSPTLLSPSSPIK